jgi:hypothetical protein
MEMPNINFVGVTMTAPIIKVCPKLVLEGTRLTAGVAADCSRFWKDLIEA